MTVPLTDVVTAVSWLVALGILAVVIYLAVREDDP